MTRFGCDYEDAAAEHVCVYQQCCVVGVEGVLGQWKDLHSLWLAGFRSLRKTSGPQGLHLGRRSMYDDMSHIHHIQEEPLRYHPHHTQDKADLLVRRLLQ